MTQRNSPVKLTPEQRSANWKVGAVLAVIVIGLFVASIASQVMHS
jgi:hypothetical protein